MAAAAGAEGFSYWNPRVRLLGRRCPAPTGRRQNSGDSGTKTNLFTSKYSSGCVYHFIWET